MSDEGQHDAGWTIRRRHDAAAAGPGSSPARWSASLPWCFAAWTVIALSYTYSRGDRAGYIQKLSKKGWICKTWEGELAMVNIPGAMQERFAFTVRSDSLAAAMNGMMGSQVSITYEEHRGVPGTCFGETNYFVTSARPVGK